jgi:hypothetical protein
VKVNVPHDVDNTSDHDPIFLEVRLDVKYIGFSSRIFTPHLSWVKVNDSDLNNFRSTLSDKLKSIYIPASALLCQDFALY